VRINQRKAGASAAAGTVRISGRDLRGADVVGPFFAQKGFKRLEPWLDPETASNLGALDVLAITRVRSEVWPTPHSTEELHDALLVTGIASADEFAAAAGDAAPDGARLALLAWFDELALAGRASALALPAAGAGRVFWMATERLAEAEAVWPDCRIVAGRGRTHFVSVQATPSSEDALRALVRSRLDVGGPLTSVQLAALVPATVGDIEAALARLEAEGGMRGRYTPGVATLEWCERRLLARIHRYTLNRLRAEIEPVPAATFMRFLFEWQYLAPSMQVEGVHSTRRVIEMLSGFEAPAASWEAALLPARIDDYGPSHLDQLLSSGACTWARLTPREGGSARGGGSLRATPLCVLPRLELLRPELPLRRHDRLVGERPGVADDVR
jgi:ATP-dependent Lhr-like helicase